MTNPGPDVRTSTGGTPDGVRGGSAEDAAGERAYAVLQEGGPTALRLLLHPYLHWIRADGTTLRGRVTVLAALEADPPGKAPRVTELRDGQIYRWDSSD